MAEKIVLETEIKTGNSSTSVKSVKQELKSLQAELANLEIGSEAFTKAAQKAAGLKDKIDDAAAGVKAFNPEAKFAAFAGVLGGVANGFAAAQGAMALFGSENKDVEQMILKTQGAMALATGISGLGGMADAVGLLSSKIKVQLVAAFSSMKSAIVSTGIGALVVAIGVAISAIMDYNQAIDDEVNAQEKLNDELKKTKDLMEGVATANEKTRNARKGGLDDLKREKELLEAKGATEKEIFEKGQEIANKELQNLKTRKYSGLEVTKEIADKENEIKANQLAYEKYVEDEKIKARKDAAEKEKDRIKKLKDEEDRLKKEKEDRLKLELEANSAVADAKYQAAKKDIEDRFALMDEEDKKRQELHDKALTYAADEKNSFKDRDETLKYFLEKGLITQKEYADAEAKIEKDKSNAKREALQITATALGQFSEAAGKETEIGKLLAAAQATIDTYLAASSVFTNVTQNPYMKALPDGGLTVAIAAAGAAVLGGLARVKAIYAVKVPGSGGGGGGAAAPAVPQFNPAVAQQVQGGGDVQLGMKPQKVYVVESDIRGSMNKVDVIQSNAKIG